MNDDRFKSGNTMNYFSELQQRIREIRISEKFFYQKLRTFVEKLFIFHVLIKLKIFFRINSIIKSKVNFTLLNKTIINL